MAGVLLARFNKDNRRKFTMQFEKSRDLLKVLAPTAELGVHLCYLLHDESCSTRWRTFTYVITVWAAPHISCRGDEGAFTHIPRHHHRLMSSRFDNALCGNAWTIDDESIKHDWSTLCRPYRSLKILPEDDGSARLQDSASQRCQPHPDLI
jgi:hypothetical protein